MTMPISAFIREQPGAVDRSIAAAGRFAETWLPPAFDGIALVGSGSSFNALTVARPRFVASRRGAVLVHEPQDFVAELGHRAGRRPLVFVLSQSGASATTIAAARAAVEAGLPTLAITAAAEAPLGATGAELLVMPVGDEPVGPKTKGFLGSVAMLMVLAEALGAPPAPRLTGIGLAPLIEPARAAAAGLAAGLAGADMLIVAGRRAHYGVALEATLKIAEMAGLPTTGLPTEELLHGRLHGLTERGLAIVIAEGAEEVAEAETAAAAMARRGCRVLVMNPAGSPWLPGLALPATPWNALGLTLPFQWLAVALAEARGLKPEVMRHGALSAELAIKTDTRP
ncbi:SIS domain-containing protein [Phreatobacter stygius]|nr:SIS domain-containing protein [Phreatobacter stygius]